MVSIPLWALGPLTGKSRAEWALAERTLVMRIPWGDSHVPDSPTLKKDLSRCQGKEMKAGREMKSLLCQWLASMNTSDVVIAKPGKQEKWAYLRPVGLLNMVQKAAEANSCLCAQMSYCKKAKGKENPVWNKYKPHVAPLFASLIVPYQMRLFKTGEILWFVIGDSFCL